MMGAKTSDEKITLIGLMIESGMTNPEIAKELNVSTASVNLLAGRHLGGNSNYLKRISKHNHLHEKALTLFLNHSHEEVAKKLGLSEGELKSCLTYAYRKKDLKHLRKDKRRRDKFTGEELISMLKYSGLVSREEIAKIIKRDGARVIKEKMNSMGVATRNINGLNLASFQRFFNCDPVWSLKTSAGPGNGFNFRIVPWFHVVEVAIAQRVPRDTVLIFKSFELFQNYIWKGDAFENMKKDQRLKGMVLVDHPKSNYKVFRPGIEK